MLCIWTERKGVEVEVCCFFVEPFKGVCYTDIDPHSHIVRSDIECSVIKFDGLISSA